MYAGLKEAAGDYVAIMDADLQDPPALLPEMFDTLEKGEYYYVNSSLNHSFLLLLQDKE